jgi:lantibiotic modifying enzyme
MSGLSNEQVQQIRRQSQTLRERLNSSCHSDREADVDAVSDWMDALSLDQQEFSSYLQRQDISLSEASAALREPGYREVNWTDHLSAMVNFVQSEPHNTTEARGELPFESICRRIGEFTVSSLPRQVCNRFQESAVDQFAAWVETELCRLLSHSLYVEFKKYLKSESGSTDPIGNGNSTVLFDNFINEIRSKFDRFLTEYAFVGRLVSVVTVDAVETVSTLVERLERDARELVSRVTDSTPPLSIAGFSAAGAAKPGGELVLRLTFSDGGIVGYRERGGGTLRQFSEAVEWANQKCELSIPDPPAVVDKGNYSWVRWIESTGCNTESDVEQYYSRAGGLVCLLYATGTVDVHAGNVIAVGASPTVVDTGPFAHPRLSPEHLFYELNEQRWESVLRTGTLPHPEGAEDGDTPCFANGPIETEASQPQFVRQNTDAMEMIEPKTHTHCRRSLPELNGRRVDPEEYATQFVEGFESVYESILDASLKSKKQLINKLTDHDAVTELFVRNRRTYRAIQTAARRQSAQQSGLEFGLQMEPLAASIISAEVDSSTLSLFEAERAALRRYHMPRFTVGTEETTVRFNSEPILQRCLEQPPVTVIREELGSMSDQKCEQAVATIRECI